MFHPSKSPWTCENIDLVDVCAYLSLTVRGLAHAVIRTVL